MITTHKSLLMDKPCAATKDPEILRVCVKSSCTKVYLYFVEPEKKPTLLIDRAFRNKNKVIESRNLVNMSEAAAGMLRVRTWARAHAQYGESPYRPGAT